MIDCLGWKIWFQRYNKNGDLVGAGVLPYVYKHKSSAYRRAKKIFANDETFIYYKISVLNPWIKTGKALDHKEANLTITKNNCKGEEE